MGDVHRYSVGLNDAKIDPKLARGRPRTLPFGGEFHYSPDGLKLLRENRSAPVAGATRAPTQAANITPKASSIHSPSAHDDDSEPAFVSSYITSTEADLKARLQGAQWSDEAASLPLDFEPRTLRRERTHSQREYDNLKDSYRDRKPNSLRIPIDAPDASPVVNANGPNSAGDSRREELMYLRTQIRLRHDGSGEKQLRCDVLGCAYPGNFRRRYELERHKKTQHDREPAVGNKHRYQCVAIDCPRASVTWTRLDKFREHCKKAHSGLEISEHILASTIPPLQVREKSVDTLNARTVQGTDCVRLDLDVESTHLDRGTEGM